jgi:5'-nucleotidase
MNILLTNDDGINAEGIRSLYSTLSQRHTVFIIAPEHERSACSNAITVRSQLNIRKVADDMFTVSGYPADCVIIGLSGNLIPEVDLIISGINHGPNVGDDLVFSGTVAGARTGFIFGKAAVAVSINCYHRASHYLDDAARFLLEFLDDVEPDIKTFSGSGKTGVTAEPVIRPFYNINYPDLPRSKIKGMKFTYVGRRMYRDSFKTTKFEAGSAMVQMGGYIESVAADGSDTTELDNGFISVTPLIIDATDYAALKISNR